jgi:predicted RNA binding protein YcfA (HicA-like mRNA interferase family)
MKKIPRDVTGHELLKVLNKRYGYIISRQIGSYIRLTTQLNGERHITIPNHNPLWLGTLSSILNDIAEHLKKSKEEVVKELF